MKTLLFALLITLIFVFGAKGQTTQTDAPNPATVARVAAYTQLSETEKKTLVDYLTSRASMGFCNYVPDGTGCKENNGYEQKYIDSLENIVKSPKLTGYLVSGVAKTFEGGRITAKSAPQISQIADELNAELTRIIVIQNTRMIELLEKIAAKK